MADGGMIVIHDKLEDTDSSGSEYDDIDGELIKKAKRKILSVVKNLNPFCSPSVKYEPKTEKLYSKKSSDIYDFTHEKRGCCLIINNDKFSNMPERPGSSCDVYNMKTEFSKLGFDVKVYNNLSASYIDKKLRKAAQKYEHEKCDCFVCIVLSHGDESYNIKKERSDVVFGCDGRAVDISYLMGLFSDNYCPGLQGKPRLFFIQACRGVKVEKGVDIKLVKKIPINYKNYKPIARKFKYDGEDSADARAASSEQPVTEQVLDDTDDHFTNIEIDSDEETDFMEYRRGLARSNITTPSPCYVDSLVMFSSPPGYFAFRRDSGSWFLKSLTYVLQNAPESKTLQQKLTHVAYEMAMNYVSKNKKKPGIDGCKNVPCVISMLTKDIYLKPKLP